MSKFWLDDFQELFNIENFRFNNLTSAVNNYFNYYYSEYVSYDKT